MNQLKQQLAESSAGRWYKSRSKREQILLITAGTVITLFLLLAVVVPLISDYRNTNISSYERAIKDVEWMRLNQEQATERLAVQQGQGDEVGMSPISRSANLHDVVVKTIQDGNGGTVVTTEGQSFENVVRWLFSLQNELGLQMTQVRMWRTDAEVPSVVDLQFTVR